jgi:hypothetical protein
MTLAHCALSRAWSSDKFIAPIAHRATSAAMEAVCPSFRLFCERVGSSSGSQFFENRT